MAEKFLTQEQLSAFCSSLAMLLRSGASLSEASSLFEEDGMDTALRRGSRFRQRRKRPAFSRNTP